MPVKFYSMHLMCLDITSAGKYIKYSIRLFKNVKCFSQQYEKKNIFKQQIFRL